MKSREIIRALEADGWREVRSRGSHRQFRHPTKVGLVTVAVHGNRDLKARDLASIERQSGINYGADQWTRSFTEPLLSKMMAIGRMTVMVSFSRTFRGA